MPLLPQRPQFSEEAGCLACQALDEQGVLSRDVRNSSKVQSEIVQGSIRALIVNRKEGSSVQRTEIAERLFFVNIRPKNREQTPQDPALNRAHSAKPKWRPQRRELGSFRPSAEINSRQEKTYVTQ